MITITYEKAGGKFVILCSPEYNSLMVALPDRRFRKASGAWAVPALRRNIEYMEQHLSNPQMYSVEALAVFNEKRAELQKQPPGDNVFPAWYPFKNPPLDHQGRGLKKWFPLNEAAILYEQGLGKTYTSINLATAWRMTNQIDAVVIVCPASIKLVWDDELDKHCPLPTQRHALVSGKYGAADKFIANKTDFQWFIVAVEGLSQGKAAEYIKSFMVGRRVCMIIDESSRIKTPNKIRTDKCIELGAYAKKRVILSGTSITQGIEDFYTQFKFLNKDIIGYNSYFSYRAQYCVTINITVGYDKGGNEQTAPKIIGYKNEAELLNLVRPYTERVEKADALDLPAKTFTNRYITMNPTQKKMYETMKEEMMVSLQDFGPDEWPDDALEVKTVLEQMLRLQQITGGHYPTDDGTKIVPVPIPGKNPKLEELMDVLDETSGKVIVWCQYRAEIALVAEELDRKQIGYVEFHGGVDDEGKRTSVTSFRQNPKIKVFLATRAAAYGLTLIEASTAVYYSQGYSLEEYLQSQDRIHRIGQSMPCTYIHLLADKTIDVKIVKALAGKKNTADLIYSVLKDDDSRLKNQ